LVTESTGRGDTVLTNPIQKRGNTHGFSHHHSFQTINYLPINTTMINERLLLQSLVESWRDIF
jgi:hypothetical protein